MLTSFSLSGQNKLIGEMMTRTMAVKVTMIAIVSNDLDIGGAWKL
jgi:hypothetical protein